MSDTQKHDLKTGRYIERDEAGKDVVRFATTRKHNRAQQRRQRDQFTEDAKAGKLICLTDLFISHGM